METHARSLFKTLIWWVVALVITTSVAWMVIGRFLFAAAIGVADTLIKLCVYYVHERVWNRIDLGRG